MRARHLVPVLLGLSFAAPAAAQTGCQQVPQEPPRPRRSADAARDSLRRALQDTLVTDLRAAARGAGIAQPSGLVMLELRDRRSGAARVWTFRSNVADSLARSVITRRAPLLTRWPERSDIVHLRLDEVDFPDTITVECMPSVLNLHQFMAEVQRIASRRPPDTGGPARITVFIKMLVTRDGEVAYATIERRSAHADLDRALLRAAEDLRFRPATLQGVPVDVWVEQPVDVPLRR